MKKTIFLLFVSLSMCSVYYHNARSAVFSNYHRECKENTFLVSQTGIKSLGKILQKDQLYFWNGRVVSCYVAGIFCFLRGSDVVKYKSALKNLKEKTNNKTYFEYIKELNKLADAAALYGSILIFIMFLVIIKLSKKPLLFILGAGSGLCYAWLPMAELQYNPWDAWAILVWTTVLLVNTTKRKRLILLLIPILSIFKETVIVCSVLILFWGDIPIKKRIALFVLIVISTTLIKIGLSHIGGSNGIVNYSFHYGTKCKTGEYWIFHRNLNSLFWWKNFNPIYFSAAGLWLGIFMFKTHLQYKIIAASYLAIIFVPCVITEARLWQELIPVFLVAYEGAKK